MSGSGGIRQRPATIEDARLLFSWVNAVDSLLQKKLTIAPVAWDDHQAWVENKISDPECLLEVIEREGLPIGQVRLEPKECGHHVDVYVQPSERGEGIAETALRDAIGRLNSRPVIAEVKLENKASIHLFLTLGFQEVSRDELLVRLVLEE